MQSTQALDRNSNGKNHLIAPIRAIFVLSSPSRTTSISPDIFLSIRIKILSDEVCLCLTFGCGEFHVYIPIPERGRQGAEIVVAHDISVHKMLVIQRSSVFSPAEAQFARFPKDRYFSLTAFDFFSKYIL